MTNLKKYIVILFLLVNSTLTVFGQWAINGKVYDKGNEEPLPGANVYLLNHWDIGISTGIDGAFQLKSKISGLENDTLVISFIGFEDQLIPVDGWVDQIVYLVAREKQLNEVIVESTPLVSEEFQYEQIKKIEIYTNPAAKADPLLAVNSLPSATPSDESANISLRGGSPAQTGVFFNDVPIYDYVKFSQLNGIGVFSIFNTAMVKGLSVFPGNPPLEYGNVSGGMVSVVSDDRIPSANSNSLTISPASFGYFRQQRFSNKAMMSVFMNYQPGGILRTINGDALRGIDRFSLVDGGIYFFAKPFKKSIVKVFNYSLSESYRFRFDSPTYEGFFNQNRKRNFTTFKFEHHLERSVVSVNSGYSFSKAIFDFSRFNTDARGADFFLGMNYQYTGNKFELKGGFSSDNREAEAFGVTPAISYALGENHPFERFSSQNSNRTNETYLYGKFYPNNRISIGGGIRSNFGFSNEHYLSRQLNMKVDLTDHLSLIVGAGKYHQVLRQLSFNRDFVLIASNQLSVDLKWSSNGLVTIASVFLKDNKGDLSLTNQISGIELYFERNIVERIKYDFSATYLNIDSDFSEEVIDPMSISYFIRGNLSWNIANRWILGGNLLYREGNAFFPLVDKQFDDGLMVFRPVYSESTDQLPNYFSTGLSISNEYAIGERMTAICFASVNNLSNHNNVRAYSYNSDYTERSDQLFSGRTFYFGAVIRF